MGVPVGQMWTVTRYKGAFQGIKPSAGADVGAPVSANLALGCVKSSTRRNSEKLLSRRVLLRRECAPMISIPAASLCCIRKSMNCRWPVAARNIFTSAPTRLLEQSCRCSNRRSTWASRCIWTVRAEEHDHAVCREGVYDGSAGYPGGGEGRFPRHHELDSLRRSRSVRYRAFLMR